MKQLVSLSRKLFTNTNLSMIASRSRSCVPGMGPSPGGSGSWSRLWFTVLTTTIIFVTIFPVVFIETRIGSHTKGEDGMLVVSDSNSHSHSIWSLIISYIDIDSSISIPSVSIDIHINPGDEVKDGRISMMIVIVSWSILRWNSKESIKNVPHMPLSSLCKEMSRGWKVWHKNSC